MNAVRNAVRNSVCNGVTNAVRRNVQNQNQNQSSSYVWLVVNQVQREPHLGVLAALGLGAEA